MSNELAADFDLLRTEIKRLRAENAKLRASLAILWLSYDAQNMPPPDVAKLAKECYRANRPISA
jgi:hypothetical protein